MLLHLCYDSERTDFEIFAFCPAKIAQNPLTMRRSCDTLVTQELHL